MKYCPACHAEMADTAKYCLVCGHVLSAQEIQEEPVADTESTVTEPAEPVCPEEPQTAAEPEPAPEEPAPETAEEPTEPAGEGPECAGTDMEKVAGADLSEEEEPAEPEETEPEEGPGTGMLTTWQYFLLEALFAIPVIGTVFLFIFSLGRPKNESLHRLSASVLIWRLIIYIVLVAALAVALINFKEWAPKLAEYLDSFSSVAMH